MSIPQRVQKKRAEKKKMQKTAIRRARRQVRYQSASRKKKRVCWGCAGGVLGVCVLCWAGGEGGKWGKPVLYFTWR
ncbi:hypothetical protein P167DRAFT_430933 [Morchella conica CCBAS932]|uniref:Uncharacterized protein n=1 Tax=Morchella conica CCBAS932 TaxID=1392247 RepID=A0A3N4L473_9PEZI|nr:hypothetical protein P167DRAFT_430933 [Morchella conica CCBAS932]